MPKEELIETRGVVNEILPDARYRITLEAGTSSALTPAEKCADTGFAS